MTIPWCRVLTSILLVAIALVCVSPRPRMLKSDLLMLPKENYSALRGFLQSVRTGDEEKVVLQPGGASSGN